MAKKRSKGHYGFGSIVEVRPGVWDIAAPRVNGKQPRRRINGTREDAVRALEKLKKSLTENDVQHLDRLTMAQVLDRYLRESGRLQGSTQAWYASLTRTHINPVIGKVLLRDFRAENARKVLNTSEKNRLAAKSRLGVRNAMRAAHTWALAEGYDARSISWKHQVPPPYVRKAKATDDIPTADEVRRVLDHVRGTEHEATIAILIGGGLRRGELLALRWRDVDLKRGTISVEGSVNRTYHDPLGGVGVGPRAKRPEGVQPRSARSGPRTAVVRKGRAKNEASETTVHLPAFALDALRRMPRGLGDALVFARPDGSPLRPDVFTDTFKRLLAECQVREGIAVHSFGRHGCASLMAATGSTMKQVQAHLRHSSMSVTADLYVHLFEADQKDAAARLDALLNNRLNNASTVNE